MGVHVFISLPALVTVTPRISALFIGVAIYDGDGRGNGDNTCDNSGYT